MTFPASQPEQRFRALNDQRIERLRTVLDARARLAFDALPDRLLHPAGEDVLGVYLMGSAGTFGQGLDSDLDLWVVCGHGADHTRLDQRLQRETDWCRDHGLDLRAFLVNPVELRAGNRSALAGDDCGSTQDRLLLDEFYRTAVLLRGAAPLWWLIAPDDERRYDELAPALSSPAYLDLGGIPGIPEDEFLGATLWHLHKAIEAPHKSLLKLLLLEAYALDEGEPLALQFKRKVHDPATDLTRLDPYLLMYERIEQHLLRRRDQARLHLARVCVLRKAESPGASPWQRAEAARLRAQWGWDPDDPPTLPGIDVLLREHAEIARQLDAGHTLLRQWTDAMPARFAADRDLQLLEAELAANTMDWPGKVPRLNSSLRRTLADNRLRLTREETAAGADAAPDWVMRTDGGAELIRHPSLAHLVAWCCLNGLWPSSTPGELDAPTLALLGDRLGDLVRVSRPDADTLLQPPMPVRDLLFLRDDRDWAIDRVSLNSWGEVSTRSLHGLEDLGQLLPELDPLRLEIHSSHAQEAAAALRELLDQHQRPAARQQRVIVESEHTLLCLDPQLGLDAHGQQRMQAFPTLDALLAHLRAAPLPTVLRGQGPRLAPMRDLLAAAHASRSPAGRAHVLLLPADPRPAAGRAEDGLLILDRDGALAWTPLPRRPLARQQDALRLFLANAGRRLRIDTRAWIWRHALLPLPGRVYLPERVRVLVAANGALDLECAESVFRSIDRDPAAAAAARARILNLRQPDDTADARRGRGSVDAGGDYPITVTDVATPDPSRSRLRDLLATKLQVETLLNHPLH